MNLVRWRAALKPELAGGSSLTITFRTASPGLIAASSIVSISVAHRQFWTAVISNHGQRGIEALNDTIAE
jgi:hypothetical protein